MVLRNLELANYKTATPIQAYTIPAVLQGMDVVAVAQTGPSSRPLPPATFFPR